MIQHRNGLFETNSSSVHAITISEHGPLTQKPEILPYIPPVKAHYFGGLEQIYTSFPSKLLYLLGALERHKRSIYVQEENEKIYEWLKSEGIVTEYSDLNVTIEDDLEISDFISGLSRNMDALKQFLYCHKSGIYTGCDSDEKSKAVRIVKHWTSIPVSGIGWKYWSSRKLGGSYYIFGKGC